MEQTTTPVGKLVPIEEKPIVPKGKLTPVEVIDTKGVSTSADAPKATLLQEDKPVSAEDKMIDDLPSYKALIRTFGGGFSGAPAYNDDEKKYLKQLKATAPEELQKAIVTMGTSKYYFDTNEKGVKVPVPVKYGEKVPQGKEVESIWGSQESAEDDFIPTMALKNISSAIPGIIQNIADVVHLPYGLVEGKEAEWYQELKNETASLKFQTDKASNAPIFNTEGIENYSDLFDAERFNINPRNIAGTGSKLIGTVLEFLAGGAAFKGAGIGANAMSRVAAGEADILTKAMAKAPYLMGSYATNLGDALEMADMAGVDGRNKYAIAAAVTLPVSLVEMSLGLESKMISGAANVEKKAMIDGLVKGAVKDANGNITKESLQELFDATTVASSSLMKKYLKGAAGTAVGEASEEVLQNAIQKASQQIYDSLYAEGKEVGKGKYGTKVISPESIGEYFNDAIAGFIGGGSANVINVNSDLNRVKAERQSESAYNAVKRGEADQLKMELGSALKSGEINESQYEQGVNKIDTYTKYYEQTKDLGLDDEANRRVFDLTWSNENLKVQQQALENDPESKVKGTIPHRRLLDTEAILEANSKEMSEIMGQPIANQQTAVAKKVEEKFATETEQKKAEVKKEEQKAVKIKEEVKKEAESEMKIDAPEGLKEFSKAMDKEFAGKDFNNLKDVSQSDKSDAIVKHMASKGTRVLGDAVLELGEWANKVVNNKKLPLYYDVDFGGKRAKIASADYTNFIKEKNLVGRKTAVQLILPTDENLQELVDQGVLDEHNVVQRTDKEGNKESFFVFKDDEHLQRYPYVLVARLQTKRGALGAKVGNLQTGDFSKISAKKEGREGLRRLKKENQQKEGDVEQTIPPERKGKAIPFEEREVDYEGQIEQAATTSIEEEDEGLTEGRKPAEAKAKKKEPSIETKEQFVDKRIAEQIEDGDFGAGSKEEKLAREAWGKRWQKKNNKEDDDFYIGPQKQKKSSLSPENKEDRDKKIDLLKKAMPDIDVVEDQSIQDEDGTPIAGQLDADGKTVRLNPNYNFSDTPIHEFAHALIDMMGGVDNLLVRSGINQLKGTDLWKETKKKYPELSEDTLSKEVLAEAIGREGAKIFDDKQKQSKFVAWLNKFFDKIKSLLGIEKNVAKDLANQLLSGKRIDVSGPIATGEIQKQKAGESYTIKNIKTIPFSNWALDRGFDEADMQDRIDDLNDRLELAEDQKEKELITAQIEAIEDSVAAMRSEYKQWVADKKAVVELANSEGDITGKSLDELNELRAMLSKYDDLVKTAFYRNVIFNIASKINNERINEIKDIDPDFNEKVAQSGDMSKSDVWSQGLSTVGEKFPAIQKLYTMYRSAFGSMTKEFAKVKQAGDELAKEVIKEYQSKHSVGERAKNFIIGGGNKYFAFMAKDGELVKKGTPEYNKLSSAQKALVDFTQENLDKYAEHSGIEGDVLLKSGAGFIETLGKSGLFRAYANYLTSNFNLRNIKVKYVDPKTKKTSFEYFGDVENLLNAYSRQGVLSKANAIVQLTKYNLQAKNLLSKKQHADPDEEFDIRGGKGRYHLSADGNLHGMYGKEFKGDFTENYYETAMRFINDAVFSKNMSPIMPYLAGVEMFYKSMGKNKENVVKFLDVVKKGKFLGETIESGLGEGFDSALRVLRRWTSWRFIAFNLPANAYNIVVGEYNQFRADGGKSYIKGKARFLNGIIKGKKSFKAYNILKKYLPDLVTDAGELNPERHIGKYFSLLAFGGMKMGEAYIRGSAIIGKLSAEHYNWMDAKGNVKGSPEQKAKRERIIADEIMKYYAEVEKTQGRYSESERRNFAYFELGQLFGQFKVWMPEWVSSRWAKEYIDADGVKRKGSARTLWTYGVKDFMRDATTKEFYTSDKPKHVEARKQLRGMIIYASLLATWLGASDDDEDKEMAHVLDKLLRNVSSIYNMDNNTFFFAQPFAGLGTVVDLVKTLNAAMSLTEYKRGEKKGQLKAIDMGINLIPGSQIVKQIKDIVQTDKK